MTRPAIRHDGGERPWEAPRPLRASSRAELAFAGRRAAAPVVPDQPHLAEAATIKLERFGGAHRETIRRRVARLCVTFLVDESGSTYFAPPFGDAAGNRYAAVRGLIALMHRSGGGLVSVAKWGQDAPAEHSAGPFDLARRTDRRELERLLHVGPCLGGNYLPAALHAARRIAPIAGPDDVPLFFVITDGGEHVTDEIQSAVAALPPQSAHVVLIDPSGTNCTSAMEAAWKTVPFGSFTRLAEFEPLPMAEELARITAAAIGLQYPASPTSSTIRRRIR